METQYEYLMGRTKPEIFQILGSPVNHYHSKEWTYIIGRNWIGLKKRLYLFFDNDLLNDYYISSIG